MKNLLPDFGTLMNKYRIPEFLNSVEYDSRIFECLILDFIIPHSMMA